MYSGTQNALKQIQPVHKKLRPEKELSLKMYNDIMIVYGQFMVSSFVLNCSLGGMSSFQITAHCALIVIKFEKVTCIETQKQLSRKEIIYQYKSL